MQQSTFKRGDIIKVGALKLRLKNDSIMLPSVNKQPPLEFLKIKLGARKFTVPASRAELVDRPTDPDLAQIRKTAPPIRTGHAKPVTNGTLRFDSAEAASEFLGLSKTAVATAIKGGYKSGGMKWEYIEGVSK